MSRSLIIIISLGAVWCLLSGHYNGLLLSLGVLSCLLSFWIYMRVSSGVKHRIVNFNPVSQIKYVAWLAIEIVKSNIQVMEAILNPQKISPGFFEVDTGELDEIGKVIYANSITLTPGTVSVEVMDNSIQVHSLLESTRNDLLSNTMRDKVAQCYPGEKD